MAGPFVWDELEDGALAFDVTSLGDALPAMAPSSTERLQLLEFLWETETGEQPVLYLMRQLLD